MEKTEILQYFAIFALVALFAWTGMGMLMPKAAPPVYGAYSAGMAQTSGAGANQPQARPTIQTDSSGNVVKSSANQQYFAQSGAGASQECGGDLNDVSFVQHLSHHPEQYADCLKKVDPDFLKEATGFTLEQILG